MEDRMIERICTNLDLGAMLAPPEVLRGGFLHKMIGVTTGHGRFAVKLLNPHIMKRQDALSNYRTAEALEAKLEAAHLPVLPALTFGGEKLQRVGEQYFYVFDRYDGAALAPDEITEEHCGKIGAFLARMHSLERIEVQEAPAVTPIDWLPYLDRMRGCDAELYRLLRASLLLLLTAGARACLAAERLPRVRTICHNDLDPKNVLWRDGDFRVIDLECLAPANPYTELCETALAWSDYRPPLIKRMLAAYKEAGGTFPEDWEAVYDSDMSALEWLEYSVRRALGIDCAEEEREIGKSEIRPTLGRIERRRAERERILACFGENGK